MLKSDNDKNSMGSRRAFDTKTMSIHDHCDKFSSLTHFGYFVALVFILFHRIAMFFYDIRYKLKTGIDLPIVFKNSNKSTVIITHSKGEAYLVLLFAMNAFIGSNS